MKEIRAIYENGVFKPLQPVDLPDRTTVKFDLRTIDDEAAADMEEVYEVLSRRYRSGHHDTAERHNEHQP